MTQPNLDYPEPADARPAPPRPPAMPYAPSPHHKPPLLAAFFSVIMPGLGQLYCGLYGRAVVIFLVFVGLFASSVRGEETELGLLIPTLIFTWFFGVFDAYRQATFQNWGYLNEEGPATPARAANSLTMGVALLAIGLYGALRQFVDLDLTWLLDHWYLLVIAVGGYFIVTALRARAVAAE
jgi:hypothetical protein